MTTTRDCALLVALLLASAPLLAQEVSQLHEGLATGPEPAWVLQAEIQTDAELPSDTDPQPVEYLIVDAQTNLPATGPAEFYQRWAYRLNSRAALEDWSSWEIQFEPSYQTVVLHHVMIHRDGRWSDRIASSRWNLMQREADLARHIFDQRLSVLVLFDDVRAGDVISIAYTIVGENPVFTGRHSGAFTLGWSVPVDRRRLRFRVHDSRDLRFRTFGRDDEPELRKRGAWTETVWDLEDLESLDVESYTPYDWVVYPWVQSSEYGEWEDVVDWALPLYRGAMDGTAEIDEIARSLAASVDTDGADGTDGEKVVAARNWIQDQIRYQAVLLDEHSHAPHRTSDILRRRYGDCKDKTVLLLSLLRALDVDAWPALVNTGWRDGIRDWLPSPGAFTHVIVAAGRETERVWIDPTLTFQGGAAGDLFVPGYGLALVIAPGESGLTPIPDSHAHPGSTRATYRYDVDDALTAADVEIVTDYRGSQAESIRGMLASTTAEDLAESYIDFYSVPGITLDPRQPLQINDDRPKNELRIVERYAMAQEPDMETGLLFEILPLISSSDLPIPQEHERTVPIALPHPLRRTESVELRGLAHLELEPVNEEISNPWFRFSAETVAGDTMTEIRFELETLARSVPPDQLEAYTEDVLLVADAMGYAIWEEADELRGFATVALLICFGFLGLGALAVYLARRKL